MFRAISSSLKLLYSHIIPQILRWLHHNSDTTVKCGEISNNFCTFCRIIILMYFFLFKINQFWQSFVSLPQEQQEWEASRKLSQEIKQYQEVLPILEELHGKVQVHLLTHTLTHSTTHSLTHSLTHTLTNSFTSPLRHSLTHSIIHPLTDLLTHSLTLTGSTQSSLAADNVSHCMQLPVGSKHFQNGSSYGCSAGKVQSAPHIE